MSDAPRLRRLGRRTLHATAALTALAAAACLVGFVRISFGPTNPPFKWPQSSITYVIQAKGSDDVPDLSEAAAIRLGFRAWEQVSDSNVTFVEDKGADANRTDFGASDIHLVLFDEDGSSGYFPAGSNIIALTPITAATGDGTILDADILFNGRLTFTTNPGQNTSRFDVQAVVTHEIGHFLGLDHSGGPQATLFTQIPGGTVYARSLCEDDRAGAATLYPGGGANLRGRLQGTLSLASGGPLAYAQVVAVSNPGGEYVAQTLTTASGSYALEGLPAGSYDVYVEPVNGPLQLADTIAFKGVASTSFKTTWAPTNPVTLSAGQTAALSFSAQPTPTLNVTSSSGGRLQVGANGQLILGGAGFNTVTGVRVTGAGVVVQSFTANTPSLMTVQLAANAGALPTVRCVELSSGGEVCLLTAAVDVTTAAPTLTSVAPTTLQGGQTVTINGQNLATGSSVVIGGQLATNVVVAGNQLTCTAPGSPGVSTPVDVVLIRPDGLEARLPGAVTYEAVPVIQSIDPAVGPLAGGTQHAIKGGGFASPATVTFGDKVAEVLSVTADTITVRLPAGAVVGKVNVGVTINAKSANLGNAFTYVDGTAPQVTALTPNAGATSGGTAVAITGSGFDPSATVTFGGVAGTVTQSTPTQLAVVAPAHAAGAVEVRVQNPNGLATVAGTFTYSDNLVSAPPPRKKDDGCALADPLAAGSPLSVLLLLLLLGAVRVRS